ncbi:MAG: 4Fe-4S dicluster domain-containing protein [Chloroflexi bacterium]|nr:4Fe-4S dicluster domain-containing protein [Chloroflexota bacterium]
MIGVFRALATTFQTMLRRPVTVQYPRERLPVSPRRRGFPRLLADSDTGELLCVGCGICARQCLTQAIKVTMRDNPLHAQGKSPRRKTVDTFEVDLGRCTQCAICVEVCNFTAIEMSREWCPPTTDRQVLVVQLAHQDATQVNNPC